MEITYSGGNQIITHDSGVITIYTIEQKEKRLEYKLMQLQSVNEGIAALNTEIELMRNSI